MQKMQILFPDPLMRKLREAAEAEDRPVSEVVRRAVEHALRQKAKRPRPTGPFPTFHGGWVKVSADAMKQEFYGDDE